MGTNLNVLENEIYRLVKTLPNKKLLENNSNEQKQPQPQQQQQQQQNDKSMPSYKALGTVLNIWTNQTDGQMIHLVVTDGELLPGTFFSAGGWAGQFI